MASELVHHPQAQSTMSRIAAAKRELSNGSDYWKARELAQILGYEKWQNFENVISRARAAIEGTGGDSSHHIAETSKLVGVGDSGKRRVVEYFLSRLACYLIAMNGDPTKPEVAGAQEYFAAQTRLAEVAQEQEADRARVVKRDRVTKALRDVAAVAKDKGVERFDWFNGARYRGLYDMSLKDVLQRKGLDPGSSLLDQAAPLELSAHEFQSNLAKERLLRDGQSGQDRAIRINQETAADVRKIIINQTGQTPESLPLAKEPIAAVRKRLKAPPKKLPNPKG